MGDGRVNKQGGLDVGICFVLSVGWVLGLVRLVILSAGGEVLG